jgi:hypothetical protein
MTNITGSQACYFWTLQLRYKKKGSKEHEGKKFHPEETSLGISAVDGRSVSAERLAGISVRRG